MVPFRIRTRLHAPRLNGTHSFQHVPSSVKCISSVVEPVVSTAPSLGLLCTAVVGFPVALWAYKCLMLVVFQRSIMYMPYLPINARMEKLSEIPENHRPRRHLDIEEVRIPSEGNVRLSGLLVRPKKHLSSEPVKTIIVYFQGNAGSPLHRLSKFQTLFNAGPSTLVSRSAILAVAPRNFWNSTRTRITQRGILADYRHILEHTFRTYPAANVIVYGHSIGATVAACLLSSPLGDHPNLQGCILENPFTSSRDMLLSLYPSKWLPYRWLGRFIWDTWDARHALVSSPSRALRDALILTSEHDEVVPSQMGEELYYIAKRGGGHARLSVIRGALHEDAYIAPQWGKEFWRYIIGRQKDIEGR
ncbi:Alpha/Beta hydrolase protein [Flagelloscypha sp. PMI_526]|nr:Alpha/Beta hydrolase protein [Flagelloscypha sp. PMI_526]